MAKILIERLDSDAKLPTRAHRSDAGLDLYSNEDLILSVGAFRYIKTGIRIAIPEGLVGLVWDKSGLAGRGLHTLAGVIDSGYRGEIMIIIKNLSNENQQITKGQKIAQLLIQKVELTEIVETMIDTDTDRGDKGFGSTGL